MGNKISYVNVEQMKTATFGELTRRDEIPCPKYVLKRYATYGDSRKEALQKLTEVCKEYGIPLPTYSDSHECYVCGKVKIQYLSKTKERMNPVWFSHRNGRHVAYIYYPEL